ncbi:MAG TPA: LppX_LprAFG lipoprotein [Acidimicrobiales bacterium]|nr:LppX_LprAFG lipoprotein [Acidimicrobiales bacterium]
MRRAMIVVVALGLLAASCEDEKVGSAKAPIDVVAARAPDQTAKAKTARTSFTISGISSGSGADVTAEGTFDLEEGRGLITTDLPEVAGVQLGKVEAIVDGGALYLKVPSLIADQVGKEWVKLDVGEVSQKLADIDISGLARAGTGNPTYALDNLRGATNVTVVGEERIRGEKTTHYKATIDTKKATAAVPSDEREALEKANEFLGNKTIPADIWLDAEGRLRKLQYTVDAPVRGASDSGSKPNFTYELYEFGAAVDAEVPSEDEAVNLADVLPG